MLHSEQHWVNSRDKSDPAILTSLAIKGVNFGFDLATDQTLLDVPAVG